MPDPNKWFTKETHDYNRKCQQIYYRENNMEIKISLLNELFS